MIFFCMFNIIVYSIVSFFKCRLILGIFRLNCINFRESFVGVWVVLMWYVIGVIDWIKVELWLIDCKIRKLMIMNRMFIVRVMFLEKKVGEVC